MSATCLRASTRSATQESWNLTNANPLLLCVILSRMTCLVQIHTLQDGVDTYITRCAGIIRKHRIATHKYTHAHTHRHVCMHTCIIVNKCVYVYITHSEHDAYLHTHMHTYIHIRMHAYRDTYRQTHVQKNTPLYK